MKKTKKILSVLLAAAIMMTAGQTGLVTGLAAEAHVLTPIASGATVYKNDKATLDASNTASGYIQAVWERSKYRCQKAVQKPIPMI